MSELPAEPVVIPPAALSPEALRGVVESFIAREGTDYGELEWSLADKVAQVLARLQSGEAVIVFDAISESCTIVPRQGLAETVGRL